MFASARRSTLRLLSQSVLCVAAAVLFAASAQAREKVTLQLLWDHQFQFAGFYAAQWMGFYEEAGLEVDIRSGVTADGKVVGGVDAVRDGRADFGLGGGNILVARDQGAPLVVLAPIFQQSAVRVYAKADSNLRAPADLLNLRVARQRGGVGDAELQSMLRAEGLDPAKVPSRPQEPGLRHLAEGRVDATMGYTLASPWVGRSLGLDLISLRPSAYGVDFYGDTLITRRDLAENNPELVKRFVDASLKGWRYALENPEEVAKRIATELERTIPVDDLEAFNLFQAEEVRKLMLYPAVAPGHINPNRWQRMHEFLSEAGMVAGEYEADALIFDPDRRSRERTQLRHNTLVVGAWALFGTIVLAVSVICILRRTVALRTAALRQSEETLSLFQNSATEEFFLFDRDLRLLNANAASLARLGMPLERMEGKPLRELMPHIAGTERYARYLDIAKTGGKYDSEFAVTGGSGDVGYRAVSAFPAGDGVGFIARDITERKRAEEKLRASEARLADILDIAPEAVITIGADMNIQLFNQSAERIFGYKAEKVLGRSFDILMPECLRKDHQRFVEGFDRSEDTHRLMDHRPTVLGLRKDGTEFPASASVSKLGVGEERIFTVMLHDVTERKHSLDALLAARAEADTANRAKSEFLAAMSHELRTPLNAVIGFSEIIHNETFGPIGNVKYCEYANDIRESGQHLLDLINDILDLSKIDSGNDELHEHKIEVPEIIRSALKLVGQRAAQGGVKLELELADQLPALRADERKMKQILVNLLSNAIKFTDAGGRITLKARCRMDDGHVFQIVDTGIGIAPEDIAKALSRFGQVDGDLNRQYEGTGLGLPLTKALVEQHGGTLDLQSEVGKGTVVTVHLPAARIASAIGADDECGPLARQWVSGTRLS